MRTAHVLVLLCTTLSLIAGFLFYTEGAGAADPRDGTYWDEGVARFVRRRVANTYVDRLDGPAQREAFYRAMDGFVSLDEYCEFIPPAKLKTWRSEISGRYAGLGVRVEAVPEGLRLAGVLPAGPAAKVGLVVGDVLVRADGISLAGMAIERITERLKGPPRSSVRLGVLRGGQAPETEIVVVREEVRPPAVTTRRVGPDGRFGVIRVESFVEELTVQFNQAVDRLVQGGAQGLVIDLRGNPGGVLGGALAMADRFLSAGLILRTEGRGQDQNQRHMAEAQPDDVTRAPLAVLVDGGSASASEVVAGALQDHRRALLIGTRTYGKFLVQQITEIPGSEAAVKLTTSRYYTPAGRSYQRSRRDAHEEADPAGLFPDVHVPLTREDQLRLEQWRDDEQGRLWNMVPLHPEVPVDWIDPQLERALQVLSGEIALRDLDRGGRRDG